MSTTVQRFNALVFVALIAIFGLSMAACATGLTGGYEALANVSTSASAAIKGFEAFDAQYQQSIVSAGHKANQTPDQIEEQLLAYRNKRAQVNKAAADVYAAITAGHAILPLIELGTNNTTDMQTWLKQLSTAAQELQTALAQLQAGGAL